MKIHTAGQTYITYHTLKGILEKLDENLFLQVHRSYIVNKTQVSRIMADALILKDQTFLPLGPSYKKDVMKPFQSSLIT